MITEFPLLVFTVLTGIAAGAYGVAPIACGAMLAVVAGIAGFLAQAGKLNLRTAAVVVAVLSIAAVAISRYGFYMASIIWVPLPTRGELQPRIPSPERAADAIPAARLLSWVER